MTVPYTFGTATSSIPLSQLDSNFNTPITLGNTAIQLGNTVTTLNNMTLANVTVTSGNVTITGVTVANVNVTSTLTLFGLTASTALALDASKNVVSVTNTGTGNNVLATSPTLVTPILGTPTSVTLTNATGLPLSTGVTGTLPTTNGGTGLTSFTANGVVYASSTSALTTGSALTFNGTETVTLGGSGADATFKHGATNGRLILSGDSSVTAGITITGSTQATPNIVRADATTHIWNNTSGTEYMRLTSTGLGIGTSSPGKKLDVVGTIRSNTTNASLELVSSNAGGSSISFLNSTTYEAYVASISGGGILFGTGPAATERMRIDSSGNVGIGTSSPAYKLDVNGNASFGTTISSGTGVSTGDASLELGTNRTGAGNCYIDFHSQASTDADFRIIRDGGANADARIMLAGTGNLVFSTNGSSGNAGSATERMRIDSSGNVGIGTTSPNFLLELQKSAASLVQESIYNSNASGSVAYYLRNNASGSATGYGAYLQLDSSNSLSLMNQFGNPITLGTNNTERARIDSSGKLLVGTSSTFDSVSFLVAQFLGGVATKIAGTGATSQMSFFNDNGRVGYIGTSGTTTSYNTSSDYRLKHDVAPMTGALAKVAALKPVTYKWNADNSDGEGFIAHELAEVCPQAVTGEKDAVDADGNPVYQGIDTSFLVATLTAAIKEQQALIESLTTRIAALEGK